jgi:LacI family transcriptional regulator
MRNKGILNKDDIYIGDWTSVDGHRLMKEAIEKGSLPSAFIVASDPMSMGVLHAVRESGLRVREDLSIISYDDIEAAAFLNPPLSSVRIHTEEVGKQAVNILVDRLKGREIPVRITIKSQLIVRDSYQSPARERSDRG